MNCQICVCPEVLIELLYDRQVKQACSCLVMYQAGCWQFYLIGVSPTNPSCACSRRTAAGNDDSSALYGLALSLASGGDFKRAKTFLDKACPVELSMEM